MGTFLSSLTSGVGNFLGGIGSGAISGVTGGMIEDPFGLGKAGGTKMKMPGSGKMEVQPNPWFGAGNMIGKMIGGSTEVGQTMSQVAAMRNQKSTTQNIPRIKFSYNQEEDEEEEARRRRRLLGWPI